MEKEARIFSVNDWGVLKDWAWSGAIAVLNRVEELELEDKIIDIE